MDHKTHRFSNDNTKFEMLRLMKDIQQNGKVKHQLSGAKNFLIIISACLITGLALFSIVMA